MATEIDFAGYVAQRNSGFLGDRGGDHYAFSGDLRLLRAMRKLRPIELAVSSTVRLGHGVMTGELLGSAVKVGPNQFPRVHRIAADCARTLGIPEPTVYVVGRIDSINAATYGANGEAIIQVHSATVDALSDGELQFVIGHECGHIQNNHVVYLTALELLRRAAGLFLEWAVQPALFALRGWSRTAEITCDRAGLLCCRDLKVAQGAFLKMVVGSRKLFDELNVEQYLEQLRESEIGMGNAAEMSKTHPHTIKRIEALRLFAESEVYRKAVGLAGGRPLEEIDREVEKLVKVL